MHGLDLRDLRGVETFCAFIAERHEALDVLVNNACQTVRRPARYYATLVEGERRMSLTDGTDTHNIAVVSRDDAAKALAVVAPEDETVSFVAGKTDVNGQQLDLREHNSWTATLDEVATAEVVETPVVEEKGPDPFTNADALRIAGDTQARIVTGPSLTGWGRLWWLARLAEDQARLFQPREASGQAIATVNDEE